VLLWPVAGAFSLLAAPFASSIASIAVPLVLTRLAVLRGE
jgi:hypothetical protein